MSEDFNKYLGIANHDIQMANNMEELKSYVANILYDNDKKVELLQQKDNIIKEAREEMENAKHISVSDDYHIVEHEKKLLEILEKEVK